LQHLLDKTKSHLCLTLYNHFSATTTDQDPLKLYHLLRALLPTYPHRLLLSSGVSFKTHLSPYGGLGYSAIFSELPILPCLAHVFTENPRKLLFWRPKEAVVVKAPVLTWECRWCKVRQEESS